MREYYSDISDEEFCERHPVLCQRRADYDPIEMRTSLRRDSMFSDRAVVPYLVFPYDLRYLYYEEGGQLLNRRRPELGRNLASNAFLVAVPEPRRVSEARPLFATTLFDLHLHDRGSVGFPAEITRVAAEATGLFDSQEVGQLSTVANLSEGVWRAVAAHWQLTGGLESEPARRFAKELIRVCLALRHSPTYQEEHCESLAQDWANVPIPRSRELFAELVSVGDLVAILLNPVADPRGPITQVLGPYAARLGVVASTVGGSVRERDLVVTVPHYGGARGGWRLRPFAEQERPPASLGEATGDLYINDRVFFRNIPEDIWRYELGGYPVLKKWLGYRDARRRNNNPLSLSEKEHFRKIVQRIAALLSLRDRLNQLYESSVVSAWVTSNLD